MDTHYRGWKRLAPLGLLMIGLGVSVIGHATLLKSRGEPWLPVGSLGICCLNTGVAIFGEAVKRRALYEISVAGSS